MKCSTVVFGLWSIVLWSEATERQRLLLKPFDFGRGADQIFLSSINQLECDGDNLYIRSSRETEIVVIDIKGHLVGKIGGSGGHPSEFGDLGVLAMALDRERLWAIDGGLQRVRLFVNGIYQSSFRLPSHNLMPGLPTSNVFACSADRVIIPFGPETGALGGAYDHHGALITRVGEPLAFDPELLDLVRGMNDSLWLRYGEEWLSIHKFAPYLSRYDRRFRLVDQIQLGGPLIERRWEAIRDFLPHGQTNVPTALFCDAKIHEGDLFLMAGGALHRVDVSTGRIKSIAFFYGEGPDFSEVTTADVRLFSFVFIEPRKLVLGHPAMLWGHDLWTATLPETKRVELN